MDTEARPKASQGGSERLGDIPALTGLRFFAAFCVAFAHTYGSIWNVEGPSGLLKTYGQPASALGMSLFFVLSGFVIHYNYRLAVSERGFAGLWDFFSARFARLYPLFFVCFIAEETYFGFFPRLLSGDPVSAQKFLVTAPYYLTLTQAWFFEIFGEHSLIYQFQRIAADSASISTEWFFYLAYPAICLGLLKLRGATAKTIALAVFSLLVLAVLYYVFQHRDDINAYALRHYGELADARRNNQDSYLRWLVYFSPYSRIAEFIVGCLICAIYIDLIKRPVSRRERSIGLVCMALALGAIPLFNYLMFRPDPPSHFFLMLHQNFGFAPIAAALVFGLSRYANPITRFFSWRPFVIGGEASYSLFLLHVVFVEALAVRQPVEWGAKAGLVLTSRVLLALATAIFVSLITYRLLEVPARRWFRSILMTSRSEQQQLPGGQLHGPAAAASRAFVVVVLLALPLALLVLRAPLKMPPPDGTVDIVEATYGRNCGAKADNIHFHVASTCSGTTTCQYVLWNRWVGDPAGGCGKDFEVKWRCSRNGQVFSATAKAEAGNGSVSVLSCSRSTR